MITKNGNTFHLMGKSTSYISYINKDGDILHYYFGKRIADCDYSDYMLSYADMRSVIPPDKTPLSQIA